MGIATQLEEAIDLLLKSFVSDKSAALCEALIPLAITGLTIHLVVMSFAIMRGEADDSVHTMTKRLFRVSLIAGIALNAGVYQSIILDGTEGLIGATLEAFSGFSSVGQVIDDAAKPFADLEQKLWSSAVVGFWPNFGIIVAAIGVAIAEVLIVVIGLGFYLLAKVALCLVMAIGPIYLLCAMWPGTEKYTESWIGQALNYAVLKILVGVSVLLLTDFASKYAGHISVNTDAVNVIKATTGLLCCSGALVVVMLNLPQLAAALSGGASISGIGRTIGRAFLDSLNKPGKSSPEGSGGSISPTATGGPRRETGTGPAPPARPPLFQRNTIERIRKAH
jgi:type IV secretion system protein VirB6